MFYLGFASLVLATVGPDKASDLYVAKLRLYKPTIVIPDRNGAVEEADRIIKNFNTRVSLGTLTGVQDPYLLSLFGILCAFSTQKWDYEDDNICRSIVDIGTARNYLADLLVNAHMPTQDH